MDTFHSLLYVSLHSFSTLRISPILLFAFFPPVLINHHVFDWWTTLPKKRNQKQCRYPLRPGELSFGMLKDAYLMGFCHMVKPSMLLIAFICWKSSILGFKTDVQQKKNIVLQHDSTQPHTGHLWMERFQKNSWGTFAPPILQYWHSHLFRFINWSGARPALCNQQGSPGNILCFLRTAEVDLYCKGIIRLSGKNALIKMGISQWIQCTDLTEM